MAASSLENKLNDLEARLKAENDERKKAPDISDFTLGVPSPRRPKPFGAGDFNFNSGKRPSKGLSLSTGIPGQPGSALQRRRPNFQLPCSPQPQKPPDSQEIEQKYQEIMKASGILNLDGIKVPTLIDDLESLGDLGHGTCGHVVKMRHMRTRHLMAVKQMRRSGNREENKRIIMDLDVVLKSHDCPYIVQCLGTFITSSDVWICMELMATCLDKLLKKLKTPVPENILGKVAVATVNALNYLKDEHGVIHRDVKPSNILMDEHGRIKLCDFGISGRLVDSKAKTRSAGCAAYMAPERIDPPDPTKPDYDIRADVWSLGISLVELATGEFPYRNCKTDFEVLTKVLEEDPPRLPSGRGFSMHFHMFVRDCLTKDYRKRPKYRKLLEHPYIQKYEKSFINVAAWYASVMGIERPKAQIQQPACYFSRSESYAGPPGPSPLVTPLTTTPSVEFCLSQPLFPRASSSPSCSDGWPSPQSSTSSRVDFSLGYSPSPSPSPSPSGPFHVPPPAGAGAGAGGAGAGSSSCAGDAFLTLQHHPGIGAGESNSLGGAQHKHLLQLQQQQQPMQFLQQNSPQQQQQLSELSQSRSPSYNQVRAYEFNPSVSTSSSAVEFGTSSKPPLPPRTASSSSSYSGSGEFSFSQQTRSSGSGSHHSQGRGSSGNNMATVGHAADFNQAFGFNGQESNPGRPAATTTPRRSADSANFADFSRMEVRNGASGGGGGGEMSYSNGCQAGGSASSRSSDSHGHTRGLSLDLSQIRYGNNRNVPHSNTSGMFFLAKDSVHGAGGMAANGRPPYSSRGQTHNNGMAMSLPSHSANNPFTAMASTYPNNPMAASGAANSGKAQSATNPFRGNPFRQNPYSDF